MTAAKASPRPAKGTARKLQRARRRLAQTTLAAASVLVRERDGNRCRWCLSTHDIHVHHITFRSQGGTHDPENLVCLCRVCHEAVHARRLWLIGPASALGVYTDKPKTPAHL